MHTLNLAETAITDAGLAHLRGLTGLRKLVLRGTRFEFRGDEAGSGGLDGPLRIDRWRVTDTDTAAR